MATSTIVAAPTQPDIGFHPDRSKYEARTTRRLAANPSLPMTPLPSGFPKCLRSPLVWEGTDWKDEKEWVYELNTTDLDEIDVALRHFRGLGHPFGLISPATFPLPTLGPVLRNISHTLHEGRGFAVIRGVPVSSYSRADIVIIYTGVSSYIGALRGVQDVPTNTVLGHVIDLSRIHGTGAISSPAYTADRQVFHTDAGDIVALLAVETAAEGGTSRISSSWRVYNDLAQNRPDLVKTLSEPWLLDSYKGDLPVINRPLLFHLDGKVIVQYSRRFFTGFGDMKRSATIPPITEAQAEALDALEFTADKYALNLDFQKGDIQYINNFNVFHGREGYRDDATHTRHLLRLWLRDEDLAWSLPEALEPNWKKMFYTVPPEQQRFPVDAELRSIAKMGVK